MKKYKIITILIFLCIKLNAQYNPYTFLNFETEWTHHSYVEDLFEDDVQKYGLVKKMITEDYIYLLYEVDDKIWYFNGFLIEKLDRSTGELIWNYHTFERSFYNRDYPSELFLRDDGILVLSSFRQKPKENQNAIWALANLNTWEFDDQTGVLLDTIVTNAADTNNVLLAMPVHLFFSGTTQSFIYRTNDRINNIRSLVVSERVRIESFDLSINGYSLKDTTIFLPNKFQYAADSKTIRLSDERIFNYRESETQSRDSFDIEITIMDNDLKVLYTKNITADIQEKYRELCYVGDAVFCVMQYGEKIYDFEPYRYQKMITYDYSGNILEQLELVRNDGTPLYSINGFNVMYIEELEKTLLVSYMKDETGSYWEWLMSSEDGYFEQIGKTYIHNENDSFLWDFYPKVFMDWLGDGKILINALHLRTGGNETGSLIPSTSVISLDAIRNTVSVYNETRHSDVLIYPNPVKDYLAITSNKKQIKRYEIFNSQGQMVKAEELYTGRVNISALPLGVYVIQLHDNKGVVEIRKISKG